ncbi:hypothetical protein [Xanthomonas campestris]|uniref:hypothetical protein n=1 Tax=Xanthomonas campestris TaxID=339 RepID=UPI0024B7C3C0|nr:hypothetical protein [Xanthomonas campestris]WHO92929.1 hypothetical protein QMY62_01105 [Xanthomonas campestris]
MKKHKLIFPTIIFIALSSPSFRGEAANCESNFTASGSQDKGLFFATYLHSQNLDLNSAASQLRKVAQDDEFEVVEEKTEKGKVTLTLFQKPSAKTRGFFLTSEADETLGTLTIMTVLPPSMQARPEDVRATMCGMLARVNLEPTKAPPDPMAARTAPPSRPSKVLRPKAIFDMDAANAALEPGTSTITGTACVLRGGRINLARNHPVFLFPANPYLEEARTLLSKAKRGETVELSPASMLIRLDGMTNEDGDFKFSKLKPGRYYVMTEMSTSFNRSDTRAVGTTFEGVQGRPTLTTHYQTDNYTLNYNDTLEKFVEIKEQGETAKIKLTPKGYFSGSPGIFSCKLGNFLN